VRTFCSLRFYFGGGTTAYRTHSRHTKHFEGAKNIFFFLFLPLLLFVLAQGPNRAKKKTKEMRRDLRATFEKKKIQFFGDFELFLAPHLL
jgi:hypothetical protein